MKAQASGPITAVPSPQTRSPAHVAGDNCYCTFDSHTPSPPHRDDGGRTYLDSPLSRARIGAPMVDAVDEHRDSQRVADEHQLAWVRYEMANAEQSGTHAHIAGSAACQTTTHSAND
jgi:hypothetical protein